MKWPLFIHWVIKVIRGDPTAMRMSQNRTQCNHLSSLLREKKVHLIHIFRQRNTSNTGFLSEHKSFAKCQENYPTFRQSYKYTLMKKIHPPWENKIACKDLTFIAPHSLWIPIRSPPWLMGSISQETENSSAAPGHIKFLSWFTGRKYGQRVHFP